jgi:hypothetical protein
MSILQDGRLEDPVFGGGSEAVEQDDIPPAPRDRRKLDPMEIPDAIVTGHGVSLGAISASTATSR